MNLADFPISVLPRQQPVDADGRKLDQVVYESTAFDPVSRRRVPRRVTLTTSSRCGLPTPADENVVLALLFISKRTNDFREPRVHFSPHQLFQIMRWDSNSRSYERLSQVLFRLKSLTLLYENAWWDPSGRRYEAEFATGIVAEYRLVKTKVRRKATEVPPSYVHWTPEFHRNLANGNLKKLDLGQLFALSTPTAQRMYRFLDKRFYANRSLEMDLREFACGHLGVAPCPNVAELKRRLAPALAELEACGFLQPAPAGERFLKVGKGIWRIRLQQAQRNASGRDAPPAAVPSQEESRSAPAAPQTKAGAAEAASPEHGLLEQFYQAWDPSAAFRPTPLDLDRARSVLARHGPAQAFDLLPDVIQLMRRKFPDARRFGAAVGYFEEVERGRGSRAKAAQVGVETSRQIQSRRKEAERRCVEDAAFLARWDPSWNALEEAERLRIREHVLHAHPYLARPAWLHSGLAHRFFLEELARRSAGSPEAGPPGVDEDGGGRV